MSEVYGVIVSHYEAAKMVGERSQVRAVVRARSRAAAGRALAAAGLYSNAGAATRHLADYGATTANVVELETCNLDGRVHVTRMSGKDLIPWPPPSVP